MRRLALLSTVIACLTSTASAQALFDLLPAPIPGPVGFTQVDVTDASRAFAGGAGRTITLSVWYPAVDSTGREMNLESYVDRHREADSMGVLPFQGWVRRSGTDTSRVAPILAAEVTARLDATPSDGRHPLILYAASFRAPAYENFALFEFLAGHGFVVAAIPSVGRDNTGMSMDTVGVRAQRADFALAYQRALELPGVDTGRVGTLGFSLGAVAAANLAFDRPEILAVASIDGAQNYTYALLDRPAGSPETLDAAYLQLTQRPVSGIRVDNTFYETNATGTAYHLQWSGFDHYDFGSLTTLLMAARPEGYRTPGTSSEPAGAIRTTSKNKLRMHGELVRTIHLFFDAHLNDSAAARAALETRIDEPGDLALFSIRERK